MNKFGWRLLCLFTLLVALLCVACGSNDTALSEAELAAAWQLLPDAAGDLSDITAAALTGREEKFPAVTKVHQAVNGDLVVCAATIGYNGPVKLLVAINAAEDTSYGIRILSHLETDHYVRDFASGDWFLSRFTDKEVHTNLYSTHLEAADAGGIIIITGSTQTTDAVILAVNAAFGLYREYVLAETASAVPKQTDPDDYVEIVLPL